MTRATRLPAGVHVFERGWLSANNVLFDAGDRTALVDSGYVCHAGQTVALVRSALGGRPLDHLLNTHLHSDHCGGNAALQLAYPALTTSIPPGDARAVEDWDEDALSYRATGQDCPRFRFDELLQPGQMLRLGNVDWEVHAAPGHDPHSVIFFEPTSRTLISADALWESGFGVVFPELLGEPSFEEVADTLDLIEALHPAVIIPGHGSVFVDVAGALQTSRARLRAFAQSPQRHARHALKVLVKFKILAIQQIALQDYLAWLGATPYFEKVRCRFFSDLPLQQLGHDLAAELARSGVVYLDNDQLVNR